ncbi:hypothetical protein [Streptomyces sp. DH24]|uniref:hypothetical protein n=1 Tax=Streptomyces sp. DH24 TaxID=3040123 RepID=UPI002442928A|nr:hypothetical protein [Streptomyces sp. DH24]
MGPRDLPVRIVQEFGALKVSMDFEKFGATREIRVPPAARTGDLTEEVRKATEREGGQG